jgi:hypothetical protein
MDAGTGLGQTTGFLPGIDRVKLLATDNAMFDHWFAPVILSMTYFTPALYPIRYHIKHTDISATVTAIKAMIPAINLSP